MSTKDTNGQIDYLSRALKAPRIREVAKRLAQNARDDSWSYEDYLAAVLSAEVSSREASGTELRIGAAGLPTRKSLEEFNCDHQPSLSRQLLSQGHHQPNRPMSRMRTWRSYAPLASPCRPADQ